MSDDAILMIPGPTEFDPAVLQAMAHKGTSHVDADFIAVFSDVIKQTRDVFLAPDSQPIILTGSGSLGWEVLAANFVAPGDLVVVVNTGYFGDSWADCLRMNGAVVEEIKVDTPGDRPSVEQIVAFLEPRKDSVKAITFTHVDTSTGVLIHLKECAQVVRSVVPEILILVDGVCALAAEEVRMTEWDIDGYLTGTQKAIGVPVGLSITVVRPRALERHKQLVAQGSASRNYYVNLQRWLPIMEAYEQKRASYYATPAVSLVYALHVGYSILLSNGGMEKRFEEHRHVAVEFRNALRKLGYEFVPLKEEYAAHTMSAIKYPALKEGSTNALFLGECRKAGAIFAGGLHSKIKDTYFRVGHMGLSVRTPQHIYKTVHAIQVATSTHSAVPSDENAESYIQTRL